MHKTRKAWLTSACCAVTAFTIGWATASCGTSSPGDTAAPSAVATTPRATLSPVATDTLGTSAPWADPDAEVSTPADVPDVNSRDTIPGEGRFLVGTEIQPGEYVSQGNGDEGTCHWKRLAADKDGDYTTVIDHGENLTTNTLIVIQPKDGAFESSNCMDWKLVRD